MRMPNKEFCGIMDFWHTTGAEEFQEEASTFLHP
jgi:hypothetical protein